MKQILTYVSPEKDFNEEHKKLVKIQIDNSLSLGWKLEDIILATNFSYEYKGVKSTIIGDEYYYEKFFPVTKIYVIIGLFEKGIIKDDLYWYHDFDCYQLNPIIESEIGLENYDMGLTQYGRMLRLCSASMFFKKDAKDIFESIKEIIGNKTISEEEAIMKLINKNLDTFGKRIKKLNTTYAFHKFNIVSCWKIAEHPIKAAHFHLTPDKAEFYIHKKNWLHKTILPGNLINIFKKYGFE